MRRGEAEIERLKEIQLIKLEANAHKGHWKLSTLRQLFNALRQECNELNEAIEFESAEAIVKECADVANFAMMIADNARSRKS